MRDWACAGALVLAATLAGCGGGSDETESGSSAAGTPTGAGAGGDGAGASLSEEDIRTAFASFTSEGFTRISKGGAPTQHQIAEAVVIWVNDDAADAYRAIDPADEDGTAGPFPVGTIVVKQNVDASGEPDGGATVLAKMDAGFNPDAGDWWWGRFDTKGNLPEKGIVGYCIACHEGNGLERNDWLHGVFADNRL